jgi:hypothetical protein
MRGNPNRLPGLSVLENGLRDYDMKLIPRQYFPPIPCKHCL